MTINTGIKKLRAAIYIRVSTDDQMKGYSPEFQLEDCKKAALERDTCTIKDEHIFDDSKSGSSDERPGWKKLMEIAKREEIDVIYFWKLDRMMRNERHFYRNEEELEKLNIQLRFATQNLDDPFTRAIHVAVAAEERRKILERTRRGREMAIRAGKWVMGTPPYGYRLIKDTKQLVIDPEQSKWVKKFYEWLVYENCSLREIARRANNLGIPTWSLNWKSSHRKISKIWWPRTLGRLLTNEIYTGKTYFRKYISHRDLTTFENKKFMRDEREWIPYDVPTLISRELFDKAINQLRKNREFAKRKKKRSYMFSGLLHCSKCGFKLRGGYARPKSKTAVGSRFYFSFMPKNRLGNTQKCAYCGTLAETRLLPIWDTLETVLKDPNIIYDKLQKYKGLNKKNELLNKLTLIDKELNSLQSAQERANKAFLDVCSIDESEYKIRIREIKKRRDELIHEKRKYSEYIVSEEEGNKRVNIINGLYNTISKKLTEADYETKSEILHLFVNRINLDITSNTAIVELNFPRQESFLQDNRRGGCLTKRDLQNECSSTTKKEPTNITNEFEDTQNGDQSPYFSLFVKTSIISSYELKKAMNPTHSRYFKGHRDLLLKKLIKKKVEGRGFIAYF